MGSPSRKRSYDNSLRQKRAAETRVKILDALGEQLSDPMRAELSVAAIAERAGVSEPTVYRYFPNREALFAGFDEHVQAIMGRPDWDAPAAMEDGIAYTRTLFTNLDKVAPLAIAALEVPLGREWRKRARSERDSAMAPMFDNLVDGLDHAQARRVKAIFRYLFSSLAWKTLRQDAGFDGAESADAVMWALRTLLAEVDRMREGK